LVAPFVGEQRFAVLRRIDSVQVDFGKRLRHGGPPERPFQGRSIPRQPYPRPSAWADRTGLSGRGGLPGPKGRFGQPRPTAWGPFRPWGAPRPEGPVRSAQANGLGAFQAVGGSPARRAGSVSPGQRPGGRAGFGTPSRP